MPKQKPNEQVQQIPLSEIRPFKNHPFKVTDDELMQQTIDSIMQVGVLNPAIIRPAPEGGYEMVSTPMMGIAVRTLTVPAFKPCLRKLKRTEWRFAVRKTYLDWGVIPR